MKKGTRKQQEALTRLKEIVKRGVNKTSKKEVKLTFIIKRVATSGMSRCLDIYVQTKDELVNINRLVAIINEDTYTKDGLVRVVGCGMDMLFHTAYTLNSQAKWIDGYRGTKKDNYNYLVSTYYDML